MSFWLEQQIFPSSRPPSEKLLFGKIFTWNSLDSKVRVTIFLKSTSALYSGYSRSHKEKIEKLIPQLSFQSS